MEQRWKKKKFSRSAMARVLMRLLAMMSACSACAAASTVGASAARALGTWHGFEQRFSHKDGQPLPLPREYTPESDLEWGTVPFGFKVRWQLGAAAGGEREGWVEREHVRQLLWSGCFIEGPTQTTEQWTSACAPLALPCGSWAASDGVEFSGLPLPYRSSLRILELKDEAPLLCEIGLMAPTAPDAADADASSLCVLQLALSETSGALAVPPVVSWLGRSAEDAEALSKARTREAEALVAALDADDGAPEPRTDAGAALVLANGLRVSSPSGSVEAAAGGGAAFATDVIWRGVGVRLRWEGGATERPRLSAFEYIAPPPPSEA